MASPIFEIHFIWERYEYKYQPDDNTWYKQYINTKRWHKVTRDKIPVGLLEHVAELGLHNHDKELSSLDSFLHKAKTVDQDGFRQAFGEDLSDD